MCGYQKERMNMSIKEYFIERNKFRKIVDPKISSILIKHYLFLLFIVNAVIIMIEYLK